MKDTLIFHKDWWNAIKCLPVEMQAEAFNSVCAYAFEGVRPTNATIAAVTSLMQSQIDLDKAKTEAIRQKRIAAARKGGAPKGNQNASKQAKTSKNKQNNQMVDMVVFDSENTSENQSKQANGCFAEIAEKQDDANIKRIIKQANQANGCFGCSDENSQFIFNNINNNDNDIEEKENCENSHFSRLEEVFEVFRKAYPGRKRGHDTEFDAFKRKHKNWTKIVPLLMPALQRLIEYNKAAEAAGQWKPSYANLSTWLYQSRWEEELPEIVVAKPKQTEEQQQKSVVNYDDNDDADFISKNK